MRKKWSLAFIILCAAITLSAVVLAQYSAPQADSSSREPGEPFTRPERYMLLDHAELVSAAQTLIEWQGMDRITEYSAYVVPQGRWLRLQGIIYSADDPDLPVFVFAVKGDGQMMAPGGSYNVANADYSITGMTIALNATNGNQITLNGRYIAEDEVPAESFGSIREYLALKAEKTPELVPLPDTPDQSNIIPLPPPPAD